MTETSRSKRRSEMTPSIPIKLSGNLSERHRCFNNLVRDAYQENPPSHSIQNSLEYSAVDRLFKIDLASKQKNLDYIIQTLKDDDMLYVTRALKSLWLLKPEHSKIVNPNFLEQELFTQMTLPAVKKMRHWIQMHLRDPQRCEEFYRFYKEIEFDTAAKFLWYCSNQYILSEITTILKKITPRHLKRLSEKVPQVTRIYFESLKQNQVALKYYLEHDLEFLANLKYLLKLDADVFFYVLENFFVSWQSPAFNSVITKYIIKHHKNRFMNKPELYTEKFLNMEALSKCLSSEEIKGLVLKLAKAEYLGSWFSFQTVEPFIKRLSVAERSSFKKLVFVDKAIGDKVKDWPYPIPAKPTLKPPATCLFEDTYVDDSPISPYYDAAECLISGDMAMCFQSKRNMMLWCPVRTTLLDQLYDQYRFSNYKQTLLELQKRLRAESSSKNRQYMLLVLVSKTGGRKEDMASLLELLSHYKNEPVQIRAAIIRSLVKRAFAWRLETEQWTKLLEWGHGLGLDGSPAEAACREGLHAVVMRNLLAGATPIDAVWKVFLEDFSPFTEYSLTADERTCLRARLPASILATVHSEPDKALNRLDILLDALSAYHVRFDDFPGTVEAIAAAAARDFDSAEFLLRRVYDAGVARKSLMREYFEMMQTDASYVNALRHDVSILDETKKFDELIEKKDLKHEKFLRKLGLYFMEKDGLGERYRTVIELRVATTPDKELARPLALVAGTTFPTLLKSFDAASPKTPQRQMAAALRANAHVVRPAFDLESFGWRSVGAKAVANRVETCRQKDVELYLLEALSWRRTFRLAVVLAKRVNKEHEVFKVFASKRPGPALSVAIRYFQHENKSDARIWDLVKSHILKIGHRQLKSFVDSVEYMPLAIRAEYCLLVYKACKKNSSAERTVLVQIPPVLHEVDEKYIFEAIDNFLQDFKDCTQLKRTTYRDDNLIIECVYTGIVARFLILSTSEKTLEERLRKVGIPFLKRLETMWKQASEDDSSIEQILDSFLFFLRFNKVFFDVKYVSCLAVFEKVIEWMHGFLPIEKWFEKYVQIHLTMIYFKTVRICLKQNPEVFSDEAKKLDLGLEMIGTIFGKLLTNEIGELSQKYFPSITEMYGAEVVNYFRKYIYSRSEDDSVVNFTRAVMKGLLTDKSIGSYVLAKCIFAEFRRHFEKDKDDIVKLFKESEVEKLRFELDDIM